jgi:hypothetical protein
MERRVLDFHRIHGVTRPHSRNRLVDGLSRQLEFCIEVHPMSISGIPSSTFTQYQLGVPNGYQQTSSTPSTSGVASSSSGSAAASISQTFNQLASDLQAGNIPAAQSDLSALQLNLQSQSSALLNKVHNNHCFPSTNPGELVQPPGSGNQNWNGQPASNTLLTQQQAYSNLQAAMAQFSLGGANSTQSSALVAQSPISFDA